MKDFQNVRSENRLGVFLLEAEATETRAQIVFRRDVSAIQEERLHFPDTFYGNLAPFQKVELSLFGGINHTLRYLNFPGNSGPMSETRSVSTSTFKTRRACPGIQ